MKRAVVVLSVCLMGLISCDKKPQENSTEQEKHLTNAKSVEEAREIIDKKVAKFSKDYDNLCSLTKMDEAQIAAYELKNQLKYVNEDCLNLNDINMNSHKLEMQDYYLAMLKENSGLNELLFYGRVECFEKRGININPN